MSIETNCFRINGLEKLNPRYRLYQIEGLHKDSPEYYANLQKTARELNLQMRAPVTTHNIEGEHHLLVPKAFGPPPDHVKLVGAIALLKDTGREINLQFTSDHPELDPVRIRYLQFSFQDPLWRDARLWLPGAGKPFFFKKPEQEFGEIDLYEGFAIRVASHPEGGFGFIVDLRRKLVSRSPLPASPTRGQINALKGRSCLYKMGPRWFEISIAGLAESKIDVPSILLEGELVSLIDYLQAKSSKPVPASITDLSPEGAAIYYRTNRPMPLMAPAELCYLVEDTHSQEGAKHQCETVISPHDRYRQINWIVKEFLKRVQIGDVTLSVSEQAGLTRMKAFVVPALRFGNNKVHSLDRDQRNAHVAIQDYGRKRMTLLKDEKAGFFEQSPLDRQYLVLPKSVETTYGSQFRSDLKTQVGNFYPKGGDYNPEIIAYDDLNGARNFAGQSCAIRKAVEIADVLPGYALVMAHRYDHRPRSADQLAAWTVKEFPRLFGLNAAVIHTDMSRKAYISEVKGNETNYIVKPSEHGRFFGYLRNVALNKILLTNGKWPFILDSPLYADIVIGIDVKTNTAAFTLIANSGKIIRFSMSPSKQKEQLLKNQVKKCVIEMVAKESTYFNQVPRQITIHRDGRAWRAEIEGLKEACEQLSKKGYLDQDWQLTIVEISKSAPAPLRLFDVKASANRQESSVKNPIVGNWLAQTPDEGYVCTTGRPFRIPGTCKPLHIRRVAGDMPIKHCLFDVFALSCLTWPQPEGVMRLPISIKLCDRNLFDEAAEYDEDAIQFANSNIKEEN